MKIRSYWMTMDALTVYRWEAYQSGILVGINKRPLNDADKSALERYQ